MDKQRSVAIFNMAVGKKFIMLLVSFVEKYPDLEERVKENLAAKNYNECFVHLKAICGLLLKIHADELAEEYLKQADALAKSEPQKIEDFIADYLARATMLSIEIQMAVFSNPKEENFRTDKSMSKPAEKNSILAVDDAPFFLNNLKTYLQGTEYKLTCVGSSANALHYLQSHHPSLFLLDIDMVGLNGFELAQKIREMGIRSPIIFITGNSSREWVEKAMKFGAADFITKPFNKGLLISKVDQCMRPPETTDNAVKTKT